MKERRSYPRYTLSDEEKEALQVEVKLNGLPVHLMNFSLGGLCVLSEKSYALGDLITILVSLGNRGRIDLNGKVVRVTWTEKLWSVAIDLSKNYKLNVLRKI